MNRSILSSTQKFEPLGSRLYAREGINTAIQPWFETVPLRSEFAILVSGSVRSVALADIQRTELDLGVLVAFVSIGVTVSQNGRVSDYGDGVRIPRLLDPAFLKEIRDSIAVIGISSEIAEKMRCRG